MLDKSYQNQVHMAKFIKLTRQLGKIVEEELDCASAI